MIRNYLPDSANIVGVAVPVPSLTGAMRGHLVEISSRVAVARNAAEVKLVREMQVIQFHLKMKQTQPVLPSSELTRTSCVSMSYDFCRGPGRALTGKHYYV